MNLPYFPKTRIQNVSIFYNTHLHVWKNSIKSKSRNHNFSSPTCSIKKIKHYLCAFIKQLKEKTDYDAHLV